MSPVRKQGVIETLEARIQALEERLARIETTLSEQSNKERPLNSFDVQRILRISPRTLQNYRSSGKLPFYKSGKIALYCREDVEKLYKDSKHNVE